MTAPTIDVERCERGLHPTLVLNPDGLPVCTTCGSLVVVPLSEPCDCGRGPVQVLIGLSACCGACALETVPERAKEGACA